MSSVTPRRSARLAEKAAANNLSSIENLYLYHAEQDAEPIPQSLLLLHDALLKERQQRLLSGGPKTFAEAVAHIISS